MPPPFRPQQSSAGNTSPLTTQDLFDIVGQPLALSVVAERNTDIFGTPWTWSDPIRLEGLRRQLNGYFSSARPELENMLRLYTGIPNLVICPQQALEGPESFYILDEYIVPVGFLLKNKRSASINEIGLLLPISLGKLPFFTMNVIDILRRIFLKRTERLTRGA